MPASSQRTLLFRRLARHVRTLVTELQLPDRIRLLAAAAPRGLRRAGTGVLLGGSFVGAHVRAVVRIGAGVQRRRPVLFFLFTLPGALLLWPGLDVPRAEFATADRSARPGLQQAGLASVSRYVHWMTGDVAADTRRARRLGCASGEAGPVLLAFGRQVEAGGTRGFDGPSVLRSYDLIVEVAEAFAAGLATCSEHDRMLILATSNYRLANPAEAAGFGTQWAEMVARVESPERVTVYGGTDLEPGWGSFPAATAWVGSYRASGQVLVSNASADGCPRTGTTGRCANGWTVDGLAELVWGGDGLALPQIYRHDGVQAEQWGVLARRWAATGGQPRFAGAMTQHRACEQVRNTNCPQLSLTHDDARRQLASAVGDLTSIPVGTDVGWG